MLQKPSAGEHRQTGGLGHGEDGRVFVEDGPITRDCRITTGRAMITQCLPGYKLGIRSGDAIIKPHQAGLDALPPYLLARMRVVASIKVQHASTGGPTVYAIAIGPALIQLPRVAIHKLNP